MRHRPRTQHRANTTVNASVVMLTPQESDCLQFCNRAFWCVHVGAEGENQTGVADAVPIHCEFRKCIAPSIQQFSILEHLSSW